MQVQEMFVCKWNERKTRGFRHWLKCSSCINPLVGWYLNITIPSPPVSLYSLNFVFLEMPWERHMFFNLMNSPLAALDCLFSSGLSYHILPYTLSLPSMWTHQHPSISLSTLLSWFQFPHHFRLLCTDLEPYSSGFVFQLCYFIILICCLAEEIRPISSTKSKSSGLDVNPNLMPFSPFPTVLLITQSIKIENKHRDILHPYLTSVLMWKHSPPPAPPPQPVITVHLYRAIV